MRQIATIACSILLSTGVAHASSNDADLSTYILTVGSNLGCQSLEIDVMNDRAEASGILTYNSGAFAAASLESGTYSLGAIRCVSATNEIETFDLLDQTLPSFQIAEGQAYLAGKLVLESTTESAVGRVPDALDNCVNPISRQRGSDENSGCRDGTGVSTSWEPKRKVNAYAVELKDADLQQIRATLSATEDQLMYLPLSN